MRKRHVRGRTLALCVAVCLLAALILPRLMAPSRRMDGGGEEPRGSTKPAVSGDEVVGGARGSASPAEGESTTIAPRSDARAFRNYSTELGEVCEYELDEGLQVSASDLLESYGASGTCSLMRAGYLDLSGKVWSCTVLGEGWVDTCIVRETDAGGCTVYIVRGESDRWEEQDGLAIPAA